MKELIEQIKAAINKFQQENNVRIHAIKIEHQDQFEGGPRTMTAISKGRPAMIDVITVRVP